MEHLCARNADRKLPYESDGSSDGDAATNHQQEDHEDDEVPEEDPMDTELVHPGQHLVGDMEVNEDFVNLDTVNEDLERLCRIIGVQVGSKTDIRAEESAMNTYREVKAKLQGMINSVLERKIVEGVSECQVRVEHVITLATRYEGIRKRSEKYLLLTSVPWRVSITKLIEIFGVSNRMAERVSKIRNSLGPFFAPAPKAGHPISAGTIDLVQRFYCSLDNSRPR